MMIITIIIIVIIIIIFIVVVVIAIINAFIIAENQIKIQRFVSIFLTHARASASEIYIFSFLRYFYNNCQSNMHFVP